MERAPLLESLRERKHEPFHRRPSSTSPQVHPLLRLQHAAGNHAVQRLACRGSVPSRFASGEAGDAFEQEAERAAAQMTGLAAQPVAQSKCACGGAPGRDGECAACRKRRLAIQRRHTGSATPSVLPSGVDEVVRSSGRSLEASHREFFESRFGHDFSRVRIHANAQAAASAKALDAQAYTIGHDVVFGEGQYAPETTAGRRLLAHELTHVVQQGHAGEARVQRKVVDDDAHVTCRPTRPGAVTALEAAEAAAIRMAERAAVMINLEVAFSPLAGLVGETPSLHSLRDVLWRRFHRDFNQRAVRETFLPLLARRYELVAGWIRRLPHRYVCAPAGTEPPGDCRTHRGQGNAWTATGINRTQLCETFWGRPAGALAQTILHEWFHFGFDWLGDCEMRNENNVVCFGHFAGELAGTAAPADYAACCAPPAGPLPPLAAPP